jgi:parvulin-like peptidyl-prolyl isomerase
MIDRVAVCLLLASLAWGQAAGKPAAAPGAPSKAPASTSSAAPAANAPEATTPTPAEVAPNAAVITLPGVCDNPSADQSKAADCKTVVTRAEFEQLLEAINQAHMPPPVRRQLANQYAMLVVMANEAHKMGVDKGPKFEQQLRIQRMQAMATQLRQALQEKAGEVPDKDIEDYYHKNAASYEQASVQRLFIPHSRQLDTSKDKEKPTEAETKKRQEEGDAAMKTEAEALQKRAAAGEDFNKLEEEAFTFAGLKAKAPQTSMENLRRASLPPTQAAVFDLKTGEVSPLIADPSGYFIFKMGEKQTMSLESAKEEIHNTLRAQRLQESMQSIQQSAKPTLNDAYFAMPEAAPAGAAAPPAKPQPKSEPGPK